MRKVIFAISTTVDGVVDHMKIAPPIRGMPAHSTPAGIEFAQAFNVLDFIRFAGSSPDWPALL